MGTTTEKLARLKATKEVIKNALKTRGQTVSDSDTFYSYGSKVLNLAEAGSIKPTGTKDITSNGTHDVTSYASASVNVPIPTGYIKPTGTKTITENGTHDVTSFASVNVNVPTSSGGATAPTIEWGYITLASATTDRPKYEVTGVCLPHKYEYSIEFDEADWVDVCGDTHSQYTANGINWQNNREGFFVLLNTPVILWHTTSTAYTSSGFVLLDETPIQKVMTNINGDRVMYYGFKGYFTQGGIYW